MELLKKAEEIVNGSTMHTVGKSGLGADWVMALTDEEGYPAASMITAARADGFKWIAFCTGIGWNKPNRAEKDPRACVYLFDKESFSGISLTGKMEVMTGLETKKRMWYDDLGGFFKGPDDERLCVLMFQPERYNIFIDHRTIRGEF
ncbi:MAG: pyridoxamine 5'-phosphate oxidase family protein [Oscillospiraceae bacterium]|nr:pyridoxamine 5'-phosphate oxidase family protein [Oscillospiraceae bacterium]